ncbi:hypothetical protein E3P89_02144 [Wallemia ichthyophaga]|uniref:Uncharacterized protein n=2 Tax=Wallemia ichthyophaga TaxID=245174 RepID=A0A4T0I0R4_WALIC|nr:uncharacterized protein J056_003867 [Wallemia ichthyophaga EXF-994]TIA93884.1 hypothetical protein E3P97_00716 [Wallemia ichthyophaga]EOR01631.1 hypothetical protein J056_003867 [Wallemia ichthyophaga EXF-994]TIA96290.1 hypothetical protein E3P96_03642 [Wallemia ichthyophaga]TIB13984.1 hypothetical protein E3P90_01467 [Wallemia ichthyophaga]TIB15892.1 hypothetical protein E3P93_01218 [Wallemia ichthyophaga]
MNQPLHQLTGIEEDAIIQHRLAIDEKGWKQLSKRVFNSHSLEDNQSALLELHKFKLQMDRSHLVDAAIQSQSTEAHLERERMNSACSSIIQQNNQLVYDLHQAQLDRQRKMEYDSLAAEIFNYPSRQDSQRSIDALQSSIDDLHHTKHSQRNTFSNRALTFAEILDACERLRGDVGAEAEEGRRRALVEMELEGETGERGETGEAAEAAETGHLAEKSNLDPNAAAFEPAISKKVDLEEGEENE